MRAFTIPSVFTAIDKFSKPVKGMADGAKSFAAKWDRTFRKVGDASLQVAKKSFVVGAAITAPLAIAANKAIEFEDKMADVGKTTGLTGTELENYGNQILAMSGKTRTSIDDLIKIGEIGGQLGIAKEDLFSFTDAVDKFNIALGSDFSGGVEQAASEIGKIKTLFQDTRDMAVADSIIKTGSAINELGAQGAGTSANISDFTLRLGALPDTLKPYLTNTLALGTFLEELGVNAQIGAGGMTNFLLVAGKNIGGFAAQMKMSAGAAKALLAEDPTEFSKRFAVSLNNLSPEKLAKKLEALGIGSQETIKVIGALGSNTERLTELQKLANNAFGEGNSLTNEAEKKNSTNAAQLRKVVNNMETFAIVIGTKVLPILSEFLSEHLMPLIESFSAWAKENPGTLKTIVEIAVGLGGLSFIASGLSGAVSIAAKTFALFSNITKVATAAQWLLNTAMSANPVGAIITAIVALIAVVVAVVEKWNDWGAALSLVLGPLGWIISIIQSLRRNWDMIVKAFEENGILGAIDAIGRAIFDAILQPLQQAFQWVSKLTGWDWAASAAEGIGNFRENLGVNVTTDESGNPLPGKQAINPEVVKQGVMKQTIESVQKQNVSIDINDKTGRAQMKTNKKAVPVKLTSTSDWDQ